MRSRLSVSMSLSLAGSDLYSPVRMLNAPSFVLPKDIRNIDEAKMFIANKFRVPVEQVGMLGESYFTHTGVTPQRVYPFCVSSPPEGGETAKWQYAPLKRLWMLGFFQRFSGLLLKAIARLHLSMDVTHDMMLHRSPVNLKPQATELSTEKTAVERKNAGYSAVPSRILGQRGGAGAPGAAAKPEEPMWEPTTHDPSVLAESEAAQKLIETIMAPRVGPRLSDSYAMAKRSGRDEPKIRMTETPGVKAVDKDIDNVANRLKKLELTPPAPVPPVDPHKGGGRR